MALLASQPPRDFIESLHETVIKFANGMPQPDDLTIVVIKRSGRP